MEGYKVINITFTDEIEIITSTEHLYQWDVGQVLEIDGLNVGTPIIHFGVKGDSVGYGVQSQIVDGKLRCGIPDSVLQSGKQIIAYIYVSAGASKYTDRVILIPVVERNKPNNYRTVNMDEVTETQSFFDSMVDRLSRLEKRVPISFWSGTQEEYNALPVKENNCLYIVTDDDLTATIINLEHLKVDVKGVGRVRLLDWCDNNVREGLQIVRLTEAVGDTPISYVLGHYTCNADGSERSLVLVGDGVTFTNTYSTTSGWRGWQKYRRYDEPIKGSVNLSFNASYGNDFTGKLNYVVSNGFVQIYATVSGLPMYGKGQIVNNSKLPSAIRPSSDKFVMGAPSSDVGGGQNIEQGYLKVTSSGGMWLNFAQLTDDSDIVGTKTWIFSATYPLSD